MDVSVHHKRGKPWPFSGAKSVLGDGMLDRARAISLGLLGVTAALGFAMIALALNQNWPLIPGAPIPGFGDRQAAIGDASIAAEARGPSDRGETLQARGGGQATGALPGPAGKGTGGTPTAADSPPPVSESVVVSDSTPASSPVDGPRGGAPPTSAPVAEQPVATPAPTAPAPPPQVSAAPQPPADSASAPPAQAPVPAGTPPEESSEEGDDGDSSEEGEGEGWGGDHDYSGGGYRGHGHAYGHGHW